MTVLKPSPARDRKREPLSQRERDALIAYFGLDGGDPLHYLHCGKRLGVTRERARQWISSGMKKLIARIEDDKHFGDCRTP